MIWLISLPQMKLYHWLGEINSAAALDADAARSAHRTTIGALHLDGLLPFSCSPAGQALEKPKVPERASAAVVRDGFTGLRLHDRSKLALSTESAPATAETFSRTVAVTNDV